jgi:ribosomal protein L11 methylase PrmA
VKDILARALTDAEYRKLFFGDLDLALEGYDLSSEERSALGEVSPEYLYARLGKQAAHKLLPVRVGRRLVILPAGFDYPLDAGELAIILDQSRTDAVVKIKDGTPANPDRSPISAESPLAFGAGTHATTRLCLEALEDYLRPGDTALDLGSGSGVLAIAAARLGASDVLALDRDEAAVRVAGEHVALNQVGHIVRVECGSLERVLPQSEGAAGFCAQFVVANLSTPVILRLLQEGLEWALEPGGTLILSGFTNDDAEQVEGALRAAGLEPLERRGVDDWRAIIARRA